MHYNPFHYIHSEKDILKLVTTLMTNTRGEGKGGDPFWDRRKSSCLRRLLPISTTRPRRRNKTSPPCWNFSTSWKCERMTRSFKTGRPDVRGPGKTEAGPLCGAAISSLQAGGRKDREVDFDFLRCPPSPLRHRGTAGNYRLTMNWNWTPWATEKQRCSSS